VSNYLFISSDTPSELLVPVTPVNHELEAISDRLIYVPLATRNNFGVIKVGEGLNINNGLLSFDRSELDIKLSTNVGSENAGKFLYVSDNGNISFVDQIQNITKVSELENDVGYVTNDTTSLFNYYDSLKVDQLFTDAITEAEYAKAIAMGKSDSKVFDTYSDMITWLGDENNKGQLIVGSNLFIIADNEPDYWVTEVFDDIPTYIGPYPSYYSISPLESKLPDISNMVTTDTNQVITANKTFTKYATFNEDIRINRIISTSLKNVLSVSPNNLHIGDLEGNANLSFSSWNRPTIEIINNTPEYIAFVSEIPTKVSELENDSEFLTKSDVVDSVYITDTNLPLSANQGKLLNDKIEDKLDVPEVYRGPEEVYVGGQIWTDAGTSTKSVFTSDVRIIGDSIKIKKNTTNGGSLYAEGKIYQGGKEVANKEDIPEIQDVPTKTSQLENDSGFITSDDIPESGVLYDTTGQNTDGAMTQKAATDNFATKDEMPKTLPICFTDALSTTGTKLKEHFTDTDLKVGDYFYIYQIGNSVDSSTGTSNTFARNYYGKITSVNATTYGYSIVNVSEIDPQLSKSSLPISTIMSLYNTTGSSTQWGMTQKAITDAINGLMKYDSSKGITKTGNIGGGDYYIQYLKLSIGNGKYLVFNYGITPSTAGATATFKQPLSEILFAISSPDWTSDSQTSRFAISSLSTTGISFKGGATIGVRWIVIGIQ
jgi:hypothetical protein